MDVSMDSPNKSDKDEERDASNTVEKNEKKDETNSNLSSEVHSPKERKKRVFSFSVIFKKCMLSIFIILSFFGGGMQFTSVGLTMSDLILFTNSDPVTMGLVYPMRGLGQVVTGLMVGVLTELCIRYRHKRGILSISLIKFVFIGTLIMCIPYFIIPVVPYAWLSILLFFLFGFGVQFLLVINNILMEQIWLEVGEKYYKIFIFSLHCCFAIAALIYPFIVGGIYSLDLSPRENLLLVYGIGTFFQLFSLFVIFFESPEKLQKNNEKETVKKEESTKTEVKTSLLTKLKTAVKSKGSILRFFFMVVGFILVTIYTSIENHAGFLLFTFAIENGISKVNASFMNSVLYIGFTIGRILGVFLTAFVSSQIYILIDSIGLVVVSIAFTITPSISVVMYIYPALFALFYSTIMTSILSSVKKYGIELTGFETSVLVFGNSIGGVFPFLSQVFVTKVLKESYVYISLVLSVFFSLVFVMFHVLGLFYKRVVQNEGGKDDLEEETP